jgi:hypothetical protein
VLELQGHGGPVILDLLLIDKVGDGLCLRQVELVVKERALREFAGPGDAQARATAARSFSTCCLNVF